MTTACASTQAAKSPASAPASAPKAKRQLTKSELRERELVAKIEKARAKKMQPRALSKVEATAMHEIAALRFDRGDEPGAVAAIDRAVRETWFVDDPALFANVRGRELEIKRTIALRTAERGNFLDALGILDQLKLLDRLTEQERSAIAGDRLVVLDKRGELARGEQEIAEDVATLDKLFGVSVLLLEEPMPEKLSSETRVASAGTEEKAVPLGAVENGLGGDASSAQIEKPEVSAQALAAEDMPLVETGTIDLKTVSQMLVIHRRSIEQCYSKALRAGSKPSGKLEVDIAVEPTGDVSDADVKTREFTGTELAKCVTSAIRRWKFPPIEEAKRMTVPFVLGRAY